MLDIPDACRAFPLIEHTENWSRTSGWLERRRIKIDVSLLLRPLAAAMVTDSTQNRDGTFVYGKVMLPSFTAPLVRCVGLD